MQQDPYDHEEGDHHLALLNGHAFESSVGRESHPPQFVLKASFVADHPPVVRAVSQEPSHIIARVQEVLEVRDEFLG